MRLTFIALWLALTLLGTAAALGLMQCAMQSGEPTASRTSGD
jgi:hypothetical protein